MILKIIKKKQKEDCVKFCKICGKEIKAKHYNMCSDCKAKAEYQKKRNKAIADGKEIKICPICGKEHWLSQSCFCSSRCTQVYKRMNKKDI